MQLPLLRGDDVGLHDATEERPGSSFVTKALSMGLPMAQAKSMSFEEEHRTPGSAMSHHHSVLHPKPVSHSPHDVLRSPHLPSPSDATFGRVLSVGSVASMMSLGHLDNEEAAAAPSAPPRSPGAAAVHGAIFGVINFIICVPTLISYAAIVFRHSSFRPDMPSLTKLFFLSSAVHQLMFTMLSSLPFAVGQVQDVGLIFLSQIAGAVLSHATGEGFSHAEALATVLVACAGATAITGGLVWLVGRLRLSGYVQLLPLPVVGGYLGYIGYFCLAAGASLGTGRTVEGPATWLQFCVWDADLWAKLVLSIAFALLLFHVAYRVDHVAALPTVLVATPICFFGTLLLAGIPLEDARAGGWVPRPDPDPAAGWECVQLFNGFQGLAWHIMPQQLPTVAGLFCVVAFGSVLDIAAIQTEQPKPLDFDGELRMIGASNVVSGLFGGFTGSYIFSQTIFSQRQGVGSTLNGWVVGIGEMVLFLVPMDVLQLFPGFYIGGIMAFFGIDIMLDWLVHARSKVSLPEYGLVLLTFFLVMYLGVIEGCAAGVAANAIVFIIVYSTTPAVDIRLGCGSTAMRSFDERNALRDLQNQIACLQLRGFLFFGAALQVSDRLLRKVRDLGVTWVVLDFTHVAGLDSTSARALAKLLSLLRADNVHLVLSAAELKAPVARLLKENGAWPGEEDIRLGCVAIEDNVDEALAWCERGVLKAAQVNPPWKAAGTDLEKGVITRRDKIITLLREFITAGTEKPDTSPSGDNQLLELLAKRLVDRTFKPNELLFQAGEPCDFYLLLYEGVAYSTPIVADEAVQIICPGKFTFEPGSLLGEVDFYLGRPRSYTARAGPRGCRGAALTRKTAAELEKEDPRLALLAQRVALRSVCLLTEAALSLHAT